VQYGAAHGALAMTTPGDTTMASKAEVLKLAGAAAAAHAWTADPYGPLSGTITELTPRRLVSRRGLRLLPPVY